MNIEKLEIKDNIPATKVTQIVDFIRIQVQEGNLKRPSRLPSINNFSKIKHISRDTVEKAYRKLQKEGYIICIKGKGSYLPDLNSKIEY